EAAARIGAAVINVSTDYVFDGAGGAPYAEEAVPNPLNVYGASKLAGERAVAAANPRSLNIRTSWVVSARGKNFVKTMIRVAAAGRRADDHGRVRRAGPPAVAGDHGPRPAAAGVRRHAAALAGRAEGDRRGAEVGMSHVTLRRAVAADLPALDALMRASAAYQ